MQLFLTLSKKVEIIEKKMNWGKKKKHFGGSNTQQIINVKIQPKYIWIFFF